MFARLLLSRLPKRTVMFGKDRKPLVLYWTDAMWEPPAPAGLGMFLHVPGQQPICGIAVVPSEVMDQLQKRKQQIGQAEALACLLGPYNYPESFRDREVVHFIDNTSALAGCIKGGSSVEDSNVIFQLLSLRLAELGTRYWAEYVESAANLADEPSRAEECPVAEDLGARVVEVQLPPLSAFMDSAVDLLRLSDLLKD